MMRALRLAALALGALLIGFGMSPAGAQQLVIVLAAASTTDAVNEIVRAFQSANPGTQVVASFASSAALAQQVANGAPAAIFLSAAPEWMDFLDQRNLIDKASRRDLLSNRVALVTRADSNFSVTIGPNFPLAKALGGQRLAMGDPGRVPAGTYGKQALEALGVWQSVERSLALTEDVSAALTFVERGEVAAGIVYTTDAAISPSVKIIGLFPENTHPRVLYPAALIAAGKTPAAERFYAYLTGPDGRAVFTKYGFIPLD